MPCSDVGFAHGVLERQSGMVALGRGSKSITDRDRPAARVSAGRRAEAPPMALAGSHPNRGAPQRSHPATTSEETTTVADMFYDDDADLALIQSKEGGGARLRLLGPRARA